MLNQKGLTNVLIILGIAALLIVFSYFFITSPHKVAGQPVKPFKAEEFILSEKITYLFRSPQVGDRVIFFPSTRGIDYLGIVTGIKEDKDVKTYKIVSGEKGTVWSVSPEKIRSRIYYPSVSKEEMASILTTLSSLDSSVLKDTTGSSREIPEVSTWKIYANAEYKFQIKYPEQWDATDYSPQSEETKFFLIFDRKQITEEAKKVLLTHIWPELSIQVNTDPYTQKDLSREELVESGVPGGENYISEKYQVTTFMNYPANKVMSYSLENPTYATRIKFNAIGRGWLITYPNTDGTGNHNEIYDLILSTFKLDQ